jgi:UDP-glucose:(heptosyl)LPS alpha-1,3-glucosyltransferase
VAGESYAVVYGLGKTWTHDVIRLGGGCHATYLERAHPASRAPLGRALRGSAAKSRLALAIERRALAPGAYAAVVVNAEMVKRDVMDRHAVPSDRIHVIRNGVDLERFFPDPRDEQARLLRRSCGFGVEDRVLLFLGSGYGRKGLDRLLDAFPALLHACPRARLIVAGRDSAQRRYERLAGRLGLGACVRFLGPRGDTETCYRASDVYVLPSRYDAFANTTLEALASGLPVVTSAENGASEILRGAAAGTVLPAGFADRDLIRALVEWSDPVRRAEGSRAARALAEEHPTSAVADRTERLLIEVARQKTRS